MDLVIHRELSIEYDTVFLLHHRSRNQHRQQTWYKYLSATVRTLRKILKLQVDIDRLPRSATSRVEHKRSQIVRLAQKMLAVCEGAQRAYFGIIGLAQFLALGFALLGSLAKITLLIEQIPGVKPLPKRVKSLEDVWTIPKEDDHGNEVGHGVESEYFVVHLLACSEIELDLLRKQRTFLAKDRDMFISPVQPLPCSLAGLSPEDSLESLQVAIVELCDDPNHNPSSNQAPRGKYLYFPHTELTEGTVSYRYLKQTKSWLNSKNDEKPGCCLVSVETQRKFDVLLPSILGAVAEDPLFNATLLEYFRNEITVDDHDVSCPDELEVTASNVLDIKDKCVVKRREFNRYVSALEFNVGREMFSNVFHHIWTQYAVHYLTLDQQYAGSVTAGKVDIWDSLLFRIHQWQTLRKMIVNKEVRALKEGYQNYIVKIEDKVIAVELEVVKTSDCDGPAPYLISTSSNRAAALNNKLKNTVEDEDVEELTAKGVSDYLKQINELRVGSVSILKEYFIIDKDEPLDTQDVLSYTQRRGCAIPVGETRVTGEQFEETLLPYLQEVLRVIETDPNYEIVNVENKKGILDGPKNEMMPIYLAHREDVLKKLSKDAIATLLRYATGCMLVKAHDLVPPPYPQEDTINLDYAVSMEFYKWFILRERQVIRKLMEGEQIVATRFRRYRQKLAYRARQKVKSLNQKKRTQEFYVGTPAKKQKI
ncbi:hypothetical protein Cantr_05932 [Candida viswanathii]|uniref:RNase MRP protein 1 RNA binding domain-containing protein n=1 Tax=Candida viswanathii TaxID=5486 RepID=A0A367XQ24_9ASCO|nr:hypothetical protein Cantr_05932 [Candida viswanathii]